MIDRLGPGIPIFIVAEIARAGDFWRYVLLPAFPLTSIKRF